MLLNDEIKDYWEGEAVVYSSGIKKELNSKLRQNWKNLILNYAPEKEVLRILDAGCGPGFFPIILGEEGHKVTGIDITENMIREAKENANASGIDADLRVMDCQNLEFPDNTFDLIISRNITWTLENPKKAYQEWIRVLKPGGRIIVSDANWCIWLYDEELGKKYRENEMRIKEKYGRGIHAHANPEKGDMLRTKLFLSDKVRPLWDLEYLISLGLKKVFAEPDITELVWDEMGKELNWPTPQFLVGAEK